MSKVSAFFENCPSDILSFFLFFYFSIFIFKKKKTVQNFGILQSVVISFLAPIEAAKCSFK